MTEIESKLWHLVRIAGLHNGDRTSKDVRRALDSVLAEVQHIRQQWLVELRQSPWRCNMGHEHALALWDCPDPAHGEAVCRRAAERALRWAWDEIGHGDYQNPHDEGRECFATEGLAALYPDREKGEA